MARKRRQSSTRRHSSPRPARDAPCPLPEETGDLRPRDLADSVFYLDRGQISDVSPNAGSGGGGHARAG